MLHLLLWLLLPIALVSGWYLGVRHNHAKKETDGADKIYGAYCVGLNYLLNEQPDKAIDLFLKLLEVNSDTVETHLALGNLFRRQGEVDRAIRIHQNLIARPQLEKSQRTQASFELAQDYLRVGFLDRAERLFLELAEIGSETEEACKNLLHIYEQQKEWQQAISIAQRIENHSKASMAAQTAQYYCELAELAGANGLSEQAGNYVEKALSCDKNCVRAHLILGRLEMEAARYKSAIDAYKKVKEIDPNFISEIINPLANCYEQLQSDSGYFKYLNECLDEYPRISVILGISEYLRKTSNDMAAITFITEQIGHFPSLRGLSRIVELYINNVDPATRNKLILLQSIIEKLLKNKPVYRCVYCGFSGKNLYWQCPGCSRWSCVKPIHGLEGD